MLIKVGGGRSGIKEYLETGRKHGRETTRDEMDDRVVLFGDLEAAAEVIRAIETDGERYLHVSLSFREDSVERDTLEAIAHEFQEFVTAGYKGDECAFYAEAHLPRLKGYVNERTGDDVVRKPHLHVVIPKSNLLSGHYLNPFGQLGQYGRYLEAFQEHMNCKYGLASPREHRRHEFTPASEIISRHKGDLFSGKEAALKGAILAEVLDGDVASWEQFEDVLATFGTQRSRNAGGEREYKNIVPDGAAKGVNLKEFVFTRDFIGMSADAKRAWIESRTGPSAYALPKGPRPTPSDVADLVEHWRSVKAREIKYLNSGNRKAYDAYQLASPQERIKILDALEKKFYEQHASREAEVTLAAAVDGKRIAVPRVVSATPTREPDNVVGQLQRELKESRSSKEQLNEFAVIRRELAAARILERLVESHGVDPTKYPVVKGKDGGDRIMVGTRALNLSDFLTKEMNLPWAQASTILRECHAEQIKTEPSKPRLERPSQELWKEFKQHRSVAAAQLKDARVHAWKLQRESEKQRRVSIKTQFENRRTDAQKLPKVQRRVAMSLARMQRISQELALTKRVQEERASLRPQRPPGWRVQFHAFLQERASANDERAITRLKTFEEKPQNVGGHSAANVEETKAVGNPQAELRSPDISQQQGDGTQMPAEHVRDSRSDKAKTSPSVHAELLISAEGVTEGQPAAPNTLNVAGLTMDVASNGDVTYFLGKNKVLRDEAAQVRVLSSDHASIELGLRLAQKKFGNRPMTLTGSKEFQARAARVAAKAGLRVQFAEPRLTAIVAELRQPTAKVGREPQRVRAADKKEPEK